MPSRRASFVHSSLALMRAPCSNATDFPFLEPDVDWTALAVSVKLSIATMSALVVIGTPIAYWTAFSTRRWKFLVEAVVALPLVLPPTVLGFYILVGIGPRSPLGRAWQAVAGRSLPFTFEGLLVASILYSLPFA